MKEARVVLLTGASASGKSRFCGALPIQLPKLRGAVLDSDVEIMCRIFGLFPKEEGKKLERQIGVPSAWQHLYDICDIDRMMRLHHRDWFLRMQQPSAFVAFGWMYSVRRYRQQVYSALKQIREHRFSYLMLHWKPHDAVFVERYKQARVEREKPDHRFFRKSDAEQRQHALSQYTQFLETLERPDSGESIRFIEVSDSHQAVASLTEFLR